MDRSEKYRQNFNIFEDIVVSKRFISENVKYAKPNRREELTGRHRTGGMQFERSTEQYLILE